jgi:cytochrome c biogenesis factor
LGVRNLHLYPLLLFLVYLPEVVDYTPLNVIDLTTSYSNYGLNRLLTNTLNKYHPLVFYFSACALLASSYIYTTEVMHTNKTFKTPLALRYWERNSWLVVLVNLLSLFMGSWWALQEGTWGGWWNWDSSEVLGLEVSFIALSLSHSYYRIRHSEKFLLKCAWLISLLVTSYFFIQLNFELVSHNFGSKFFFFFNNNLFSIEVILCLLLTILTTFKYYRYSSEVELNLLNQCIQIGTTATLNIFKNYAPLLILAWLFLGYKPLMNYFSWNFLGLNLFNYDSSIQTTNLLLLIGLLLWAMTYTKHPLLLCAHVTTISVNWIWLLLLTFTFTTTTTRIHGLIVTFTALNLTLADLFPVYWFTQSPYLNTFSPSTASWVSEVSAAADTYSWDLVKGISTLSTRATSSWDTISLMNTPSTNFFSLELSNSTSLNYYELGASYTTACLEFQLPLTPTLASVFLLGGFYLFFLRHTTSIYIF